jgi:hypothetical protein
MLNLKIFKKKLSVLFLILSVLLLVACDKSDQKSTRSGYYIEEPSHGNSGESPSVKAPQIYYLFDRTLSMLGYVAKNNTEYTRIIPQLWMVAESSSLWPGSETSASFYKFGEGDIRRVSRESVRDRVRRWEFYNSANKGTLALSTGDRQVFATAAKYITSQSSPDKLFIVVTDLYEQNREDNCFSALFRDAFEHGMSGAIIAIESEFDGSIENISDNMAANIRVNGTSTFFIFVIGGRDALIKYCEAFFATPDFQSLKSEKVLFLLGDESGPTELPWTPSIRNANSDRVFERIAQNNNINLKEGIPKLFTVEGTTVDPLKVGAFRLIGNVRSQYIGGLPLKNIDPGSFTFESSYTVEYCRGDGVTQGNLSTFELINDKEKTNFLVDAFDGSIVADIDAGRYPLAVAINTKNDSLEKGCYYISYEIFQKAKIPQWVTGRSAGTLSELEESKSDGVIKILRLESIYRYIAEAYNNRPEWGRVYADSLYLEKQR